jgi:hypothetical protein
MIVQYSKYNFLKAFSAPVFDFKKFLLHYDDYDNDNTENIPYWSKHYEE